MEALLTSRNRRHRFLSHQTSVWSFFSYAPRYIGKGSLGENVDIGNSVHWKLGLQIQIFAVETTVRHHRKGTNMSGSHRK